MTLTPFILGFAEHIQHAKQPDCFAEAATSIFIKDQSAFNGEALLIDTKGRVALMSEIEAQYKQNIKDLVETQRIAHIGTWRLDLKTNHVAWSEELCNLLDVDPAFPPTHFAEQKNYFTQDSWDRLTAALEQTRISGIPYEMEVQTITKKGANCWLWVRSEAERDQNGNIIAIWGAAQDITERKKAEYALKSNEEKFQLFFNQAPLEYQSLDFEGHLVDVNQKWLDTFGYTNEEVIGKYFSDFLCPEYVAGFRECFSIFKSQGFTQSEFEMLSKGGQRFFMRFIGKIVYDADGKFMLIHCILQDITKQRKAELALIESEERYRCLFDNLDVGIVYYTTDGVVISFNRKAMEIIGGKTEDYVGRPIREIFSPKEADKLYAIIEDTQKIDQVQLQENRVSFATGPKWLSSMSVKVTNLSGEVLGVLIASEDITDRKKAESELFESQAILKASFENSQAGIAIADAPDGKIRYVNKAGLMIINNYEGETDLDLIIHNNVESWKICHFDGTPYTENEVPLSRAILYGETCSEEFMIRRDHSEDRFILANTSPIRDSNNNIMAGISVFLDITEKRKAAEVIKKQNDVFISLLRLLPVGVFMVDAKNGTPLIANDKGKEILGQGILPDANEHNLSEIYKAFKKDTKEQYPAEEMPIILGMKGISAHIEDMVVEHPDGHKLLLEVFGSPVNDRDGNPWASLVTFMDITERKKTESDLIYLNYHDNLTGFFNRRYFEDTILKVDIPVNLPLSIIICDINGLKLMNDSFGHAYGDELLVKAAKTIKEVCRTGDIISRIGGDEFAVILPRTDEKEAMQIATNIKQLALKERVANIELSISYGYDTKTSEKQNIIEVISNAENHMYRHKLYERSSMRSKTIDIIMNTLFEKSNRESMHSNRVSSICMAIASNMNFDNDDVNKIRIAGLVHDIGKIGIDEKILNKPGKLTEDERDQVNKHPEVGWRILSSASEFSELANFILDHHERWDGRGYPNGLKGEDIPLEARIIAVADSFDAMTSERSYRSGLSQEEAIAELMRCSGTQFDPQIVAIFVDKVIPSNTIS